MKAFLLEWFPLISGWSFKKKHTPKRQLKSICTDIRAYCLYKLEWHFSVPKLVLMFLWGLYLEAIDVCFVFLQLFFFIQSEVPWILSTCHFRLDWLCQCQLEWNQQKREKFLHQLCTVTRSQQYDCGSFIWEQFSRSFCCGSRVFAGLFRGKKWNHHVYVGLAVLHDIRWCSSDFFKFSYSMHSYGGQHQRKVPNHILPCSWRDIVEFTQ